MFDCYHIELMEIYLNELLKDLLSYVGHIQFASVPNRGAPDYGGFDLTDRFFTIKELGWTQPMGAEYEPTGDTEKTSIWLAQTKNYNLGC